PASSGRATTPCDWTGGSEKRRPAGFPARRLHRCLSDVSPARRCRGVSVLGSGAACLVVSPASGPARARPVGKEQAMKRTELSPRAYSVAVAARGGPGLWLALVGVLLLALIVPAIAAGPRHRAQRAKELNLGALPQEVRQALDRASQVYEQPLK